MGLVTKYDFEMALQEHQVSKDETNTKSEQRNRAKLAKAHAQP